MSAISRLRNIELGYEMNKERFPTMPNYEEWTDEQLEADLLKKHNEFINENAIKSFQDIIDKYSYWLSKNLITEDDFNMFVYKWHKRFWEAKN